MRSLLSVMHSTETQHQVTLEKLVYVGEGLGRLASGEVVFVPWSAHGDNAQIAVIEQKKHVLHGQITELLQPSPIRTQAPCSVYGQCGGCQWQHITLEGQRDWKQKIVLESLNRI